MACPAAPCLLLVMTLPLVGSPVVPTSQPEQGQTGGESGQQLDQESGAGESVLVSVYIHLEFSDKTWPPVFSRPLALPTASAASSQITLTHLNLTTECKVTHAGYSHCSCLSGYQWNADVCSRHLLCQPQHQIRQPCACLVFSHAVPGYCQLLPPVPGKLRLNSELQVPGDTLNLTLDVSQEATNVSWFLKQSEKSTPILLQKGEKVSLTSSQGQFTVSISSMTQYWAGEYMSCFEAQGFRWELYQVVRVRLQKAHVVRVPDQLSISCANSSGFQLNCCIPSTYMDYTFAWSPEEGSQASLVNTSGFQCLMLSVQHCPATNTIYTCLLKSQDLDPLSLPVPVTIIRDGDITCPENFSVVPWNVTKAGHVAQTLCPKDKKGVVKRPCGPDGIWGPVQNDCTDLGILTLKVKAKLLQKGQGRPAEEVPQILKQLQMWVVVASSSSDVVALLHTVKSLSKVVAKARMQLDRSALADLLKTTDNILDMDISSLWSQVQIQKPKIGSHFLLAVEALASSLSPQEHPFSFNSSNVLLQSQFFDPTLPEYQISFSTQPPLRAQIPSYPLAPLGHNGVNISITSLVLRNVDGLLPSNYGQGLGDSYATAGLVFIISIMAGGQAFTQAEVMMDFGDTDGSLHCVFWDHKLFEGEGGWSGEGCQADTAVASPATWCICQHLTAFSILMSPHTILEDPVLVLLSQMGLGTSILALLVCLGVYRLVWRVVVRNKVAFFRHAALFNMVICLLAADTFYLGAPFLSPGHHSPLCLATAFLTHFFYLATFFWMLAQALVLVHQLLFVFHQLSKPRVLSLMVILGYLLPLVFAGVALGLYLPQGRYLREGECWLDGKGGVLYTFAGPVLAIVGMNGLVLATAVLKLLRPSLSEGPPVEKRQALLGVIKALLILTPIFGLTWGVGLATLLEEVSVVPHYVFTALNSFQGVFILLFGCLTDKKVQEALRKRFCSNQSPNSTISRATNETYETYVLEQSKERSENASYEERMTDRNL